MKIEDFKVGETYLYDGQYEEKVLHIIRQQKKIVTINLKGEVWVFEENELENFKPIKEQLPEEGLLVSSSGSLVYKLSDGSGYGFANGSQSGYYFNNDWGHPTKYWKPATEEQEKKFIEMLKKECENRGLFEDTKLSKCGINSDVDSINRGIFTIASSLHRFWNKNGRIFDLGKFATPLKEETTLELVSKAVQEIGDFIVEQTESGVIILTPIKK